MLFVVAARHVDKVLCACAGPCFVSGSVTSDVTPRSVALSPRSVVGRIILSDDNGMARCLSDNPIERGSGGPVLAELVGLAGDVVVAGAGEDESVSTGLASQPCLAVDGVLAVVEFEAEESRSDKVCEVVLGDDLSPAGGSRMGEHGHPPAARISRTPVSGSGA